jgi:hypothetical protein
MTELDFDELDKAVSSLMTEDKADDTPLVSDSPSTPLPQTPQPTTQPQTPSPAVRRRGQFMDVIHPSSDMRQASTPVSRQAAAITPPIVQKAPLDATPPIHDELVSSQVEDDTAPHDTPHTSETLPTMEDTSTASADESKPQESAHSGDITLDDMPADISALPTPDDNPLVSPFLPDAKVEKRPLGMPGAFNDGATLPELPGAPSEDDAHAESSSTETETITDEKNPVETPEPAALPDELKEDIVAVESNEVMQDDEAATVPTQEEVPEPSAAETPAHDEPLQPVSNSIPPQYQEQPSTGDQTSGAIYDTNTYHQALDAKSPKKKSPILMWILWIVVLLIVGATAGAAWFYFTTQ